MITPASIIVNLDLSKGSTAIDYSPLNNECPIIGIQCMASAAGATLSITPLKSVDAVLQGTGTGGRLRVRTSPTGALSSVEVAAGGTGYGTGPVSVVLLDPYGTAGSISATASGGVITGASIGASGSRYSGVIDIASDALIEGVVYNIVPRYLEVTSGSASALNLIGYKFPYRPYQIF